MEKREANGRIQRMQEPDRGTPELQARREALAGDARRPIDIADPIDVMHRGQPQLLTDTGALVATIWRAAHARVMQGEGPRLAMLRERTGPAPEDSDTDRAKEMLDQIRAAMLFTRADHREMTKMAVLYRAFPKDRAVVADTLHRIARTLRI